MATLRQNPETIDRGEWPTVQSHGFVVGRGCLQLGGEYTQVHRFSMMFDLSEDGAVCGNQNSSVFNFGMRYATGVPVKEAIVTRIKRVFWLYTLGQSLMHFTDIDTAFSTPLRHGLCAAIDGKPPIVPQITSLFDVSCPADIARFIIPVRIRVTINTMPRRWSLTDIDEKSFKRMQPTFTDCNSTSAVVRPRFNSWVGASLYDARPDAIGRCFRHAVGACTHGIIQNHVRAIGSSIRLNCSHSVTVSQGA